jgi:hypothetical protein
MKQGTVLVIAAMFALSFVLMLPAQQNQNNFGTGVTVSGAVTAGHIATFVNSQTIQDGGAAAGTTINPTNNCLPKRSNATTFVDSSLCDNGTIVTGTEPINLSAGSTGSPSLQNTASGVAGVNFLGNGTVDLISGAAVQLHASTSFVTVTPPFCDAATGTGCFTFAANLISVTGAGNAILHSTNNTKAVGTSDFTSANSAALQAITGLSFPLGSTAQVFTFHCALKYSQATPSAGDQFGVGVITTAPTNVSAGAEVWQNTTQGTSIPGTLDGLATTTPTAVVTFTPAVTSIMRATMDGTIETAGGGAATFNVYVLNGTAANVMVVKRGSECTIN